jgi:hypothetical protein
MLIPERKRSALRWPTMEPRQLFAYALIALLLAAMVVAVVLVRRGRQRRHPWRFRKHS